MSYLKLHVLTIIAVLFLCSSNGTATADCLASFREIKFPDGSARVKNYVCKTEGSEKPEIRVEFDRLSEAAAGSLIEGTPYPDMDRAFGKVRVINNAVATETKKLFDEFGAKREYRCLGFLVSTAAGGKEYDGTETCREQKTGTPLFLTVPEDASGAATINMPLISDAQVFNTSNHWPAGYNFFYSSCSGEFDPINCTTLWRAARPQDFANYIQDMISYDKALGLETDTPEQAAATYKDELRYFKLIEHLTQGKWPADFLIVTGNYSDCGGSIEFNLPNRHLILDVAFIQNVSNSPMQIGALLGTETASTGLRPTSLGTLPDKPQSILLSDRQIQPRETIAVPLAITFVMDEALADEFSNQGDAEKTFKRIQSARSGTVFKAPTDPPIRKTRESFDRPTAPKPATYAFGPELRVSGLVVDGRQIVFDQASRNFLKLTSSAEEGSCPYLYAWDDKRDAWVRHGKVIHEASSKDKEETQTIAFPGFRSKFRLAEEELEVSFIDHVKLEIELKDGTGMTLKPNLEAMAEQDARYATIKAGDRIEFSFALPPTVKPEDVKQSTLAITGYYRRYSDLLMARQ